LLASALLDGHFAHPAWLFSIVPNLDIYDGYRGQNEFFRSLLVEKVRSAPGMLNGMTTNGEHSQFFAFDVSRSWKLYYPSFFAQT
jgi:hypothetical protein